MNKKLFLCIVFITNVVFMLQAQNTSLPVGAIPGAIDVSPMGAATYTIPIEVVPGTQGLQPNLSIVYNSFGGMGLLGMKWNLAGLSAITRCGQTPYYDGSISAIQFNSNDRFAIDGNRLTLISGTYGTAGAQYATEIEDFSRFFSNSDNSISAYTDDGSIIEYGKTTDSKQAVATNTVLSWYINKITDANGNYMTFHYGGGGGKEIWINEINYTGNVSAGIQTYAKMEFNYIPLPDNMGKNTCFVGGYGIPQTKLLETIMVYYGNAVVRKYEFNYNINDTGERTAHLKEVVLYGEGGTEYLNATTLTWGAQNTEIVIPQINGLPQGTYQGGIILTGDFDGDGYTDVILYGTGNDQDTWKLYLYNSVSNTFVFNKQGTHQEYSAGIKCYSYIEETRHKFLIAEKDPKTTAWHIKSISPNPFTEFSVGSVNNLTHIYFGDFDGDGSQEMLFLRNIDKKQYELLDFNMNSIIKISADDIKDCKIYAVDMNGNGKENLQIVIDSVATTYEYNNGFNIIKTDGFPTKWHYVYYGDFNGDGIKDALVYCNNSNSKEWKLHIGKGNNSFTHPGKLITQLNGMPESFSGISAPKYPVIVADLNGDGKDEIIQSYYESTGEKRLDFYALYNFLSDGSFTITQYHQASLDEYYMYASNFSAGDFNGDGKMDILLRSSVHDKPRIIFSNKNEQYQFVKKIEDGIGKKIDLSYIHKYFKVRTGGMGDTKYFLSLAESVKVQNGTGNGFNIWQYQYDLPKFAFTRRTFLGFEDYVCINTTENKKEVFSFTVKYPMEMMIPNSQTSFCNNQKTNEKLYTFQLKYLTYYRFAAYYSEITEKDILSDIKIETTTDLNEGGRMETHNTKMYNACDATTWIHSETNAYTYDTIDFNYNFNGIIIEVNQKKTVPTQIITTQEFGNNGLIIADTLTYNYFTTGSNKGCLHWMRKGNIDGSITTTYENYTATGLYGKKTVSTQGCDPRSETYTYDATQRFVTTITNPLNHTATFSYNFSTGNKTSETDPNGLTTTYDYDAFGDLTKITYPNGMQTKDTVQWYTASAIPHARYYTTTTTTGKPTLIVYYDTLGREVCRQDDDYYYDTRYNAKGQVVKTSYPYSNIATLDSKKIWNEFTYDNYGRMATDTAPYKKLSYSYDKRKVTVTDHLRNVSSWKDYDALGRIINAKDTGGLITYTYTVTPEKRYKTVISTNGATTTIFSDLWGNRRSITEPNAGKITSEYNDFNELIKQIDARSDTISYEYDKLGRVTQKRYAAPRTPSLTYTYLYDKYAKDNRGRGKLYQINIGSNKVEEFTYDALSRLTNHTKENYGFTKYTYTPYGQLHTLSCPANFSVTYSYTTTGKLKDIRRTSDNSLIYRALGRNEFGATTLCDFGNDLATAYTYNPYGLLTQIKTGHKCTVISEEGEILPERGDFGGAELPFEVGNPILHYQYTYNGKGLMTSRSESIINHKETYTYDNLDRLTGMTSGNMGQPGTPQTFSYHDNGNMSSHSKVGNYIYHNTKPHAVAVINQTGNAISENQCAVTYNFFNQPIEIIESDPSTMLSGNRLELFYGTNQQRIKTIQSRNDTVERVRHYVNKYFECESDRTIDSVLISRYYFYIYGDNGVVAMNLRTQYSYKDTTSILDSLDIIIDDKGAVTTDSMYYIHTDHLGSYCAITNATKQVRQRNWFDPWGNYQVRYDTIYLKKPVPTIIEIPAFPLTCRGFTGHEHYLEFKIINMNGRLYDPVIGRFFSPDKYVANSSFTQDFNRYCYARNNPLMYTDPDGELPVFVIPLIIIGIQATMNVITHWSAIKEASQQGGGKGFGTALGFFAIGAVDGAASYYLGPLGKMAVGFGTNILNSALEIGNFKDINYGRIAATQAISFGISMFSNNLVNSTDKIFSKFYSTIGGRITKNVITQNITSFTTNLITTNIYQDYVDSDGNGNAFKYAWSNYWKNLGWLAPTVSGITKGTTDYISYKSRNTDLAIKNAVKKQLLKSSDFRKDFSKFLKDDISFSKADRFELMMYRFNLPFTNAFNLMFNKPIEVLQINTNVEPIVPTITIPKE